MDDLGQGFSGDHFNWTAALRTSTMGRVEVYVNWPWNLCVITGPPQWLAWISGKHTYTHRRFGSPLGLQRTFGTKAEEGEQNKLVNYPSQALTTNIWVNRDSNINYVSQWNLEEFTHRWSELHSILELLKPLEQNPWRMLHMGDPGMTSGGRSPSLGTEVLGRLDVVSPLLFPLPLDIGRRKKIWKQWSYPLSPGSQLFPSWSMM